MSASSETPSGKSVRARIALVVFVLVPAACLTLLLSLRGYTTSVVDRLEARIRQSGQPVTLIELAATYPPIPDADNGAVLLLRLWESNAPEFWSAFRNGAAQLPARPEPKYDRALPFLGADWQRLSRTAALPSTNLVAAETYLDAQKEHLAAAHEAFRCAGFRFPIQITNGFSALVPHVDELKREATRFRIEALVKGERGDVDGAIAALGDVANAGSAMADESTLISQLVRISCYGMAIEELQRLCTRQALSSQQLDAADALLGRLRANGALRQSLIGERAMYLDIFKRPADTLARIGPGPGDEMPSTAPLQIGMGLWAFSGMKAADLRLLLETFERAIALAERDDSDALVEYETLFRDADAKARRFPPKIISSLLLPGFDRMATKFASLEARRRAGEVALAVERYRLNHDGRLPGQLKELVPQFLKQIPTDPFDGEPLRFLTLTNGFEIYSIGANRVDDGGKERSLKRSDENFDETFFIER